MEFFVCPCPATGNVILNGYDQGPNKNAAGELLAKQCNAGKHTISLQFADGSVGFPPEVTIVIRETDPILPKEVPFQCAE